MCGEMCTITAVMASSLGDNFLLLSPIFKFAKKNKSDGTKPGKYRKQGAS